MSTIKVGCLVRTGRNHILFCVRRNPAVRFVRRFIRSECGTRLLFFFCLFVVIDQSVELTDHASCDSSVTRSVRDIDNDRRRKYLYSIPISTTITTVWNDENRNKMPPPIEMNDNISWRLPSPSGRVVAQMRSESAATTTQIDACKKPIRQVLEIWTDYGHHLQRRIVLSEKHGKVIYDMDGFGRPVWNDQETILAYSAERKAPETESFFDPLEDSPDKGTSSTKTKIRGGMNVLGVGQSERWGEQYPHQEPLLDIWCVHLHTGRNLRVTNAPEQSNIELAHTTTAGGYALGQIAFTPDGKGLVYTGWDAGGGSDMPRRLGLIFCQQRSSKLYYSSINDLVQCLSSTSDPWEYEHIVPPYISLTPDVRLARSPCFTPDGQYLLFLVAEQSFDTHAGCWGLSSMDWPFATTKRRAILAQVDDPRSNHNSAHNVVGLNFPGLFLHQITQGRFTSPRNLLLTTQWGACHKIIRINIDDGKVEKLPSPNNDGACSDKLLCLYDSCAIISSETPHGPAKLYQVSSVSDDVSSCDVQPLFQFSDLAATSFSPLMSSEMNVTSRLYVLPAPTVEEVPFDIPSQSILMMPKGIPKPPLIVIPHGGPHAASSTSYLPSYAYLCGHGGFALLLVNYRGSTGFGQACINSLPGRIGTLDVADVMHVTREICRSNLVDPTRVGICGGSHGGFLTCHCTGQFPDFFRAAAMRNPVVNLPSMTTVTDIPDWCFVEATGESYDWSQYRVPTESELSSMRQCSPIQYVSRVKTPTLIGLGLCDLRVPPSQGLEWFHVLRSRGVPTKLLQYQADNHSIAGVRAEADYWIHVKQWFDAFLNSAR